MKMTRYNRTVTFNTRDHGLNQINVRDMNHSCIRMFEDAAAASSQNGRLYVEFYLTWTTTFDPVRRRTVNAAGTNGTISINAVVIIPKRLNVIFVVNHGLCSRLAAVTGHFTHWSISNIDRKRTAINVDST